MEYWVGYRVGDKINCVPTSTLYDALVFASTVRGAAITGPVCTDWSLDRLIAYYAEDDGCT